MATISAVPSRSFLAAFLPVARASLFPQLPQRSESLLRRIPALQQLRSSIIPAVLIPIPGIIETIWEGILKAVPKKKTSHMKKRHRFMAGKALRDVTALNKCSACGRLKRAHVLCPYCVQSIKRWFGTGFKTEEQVAAQEQQKFEAINQRLKDMGKEPLRQPKKEEKTDG